MEQSFAGSLRERQHGKLRVAQKKSFLIVLLVIGFVVWAQGVQAQQYPTKPINLLISFAPGGPVDTSARKLAPEVSKALGQELIVINKPGGGGSLAAGILANSKGDGYTLLAQTTAGITNAPHLESVPFNPLTDLIPVVQFGVLVVPFVVPADSPFKSFKDLVEFARKNQCLNHGGLETIPSVTAARKPASARSQFVYAPTARSQNSKCAPF